nr:aminotransferase class IV [bacterium]
MKGACYIDGKIVPAEKAVVPVDDLAFLRGYGVFDFLRTYGGRPFHPREHLRRLRASARAVALPFPWEEDELMGLIDRVLAAAGLPEATVRIVVSGGSSPDFFTPGGDPRLVVLAAPVQACPAWWYQRGVSVSVVRRTRSYPGAKTLNYLAAVVSVAGARSRGAVEALLVDGGGMVREGETTNLFMVSSGRLVTPGEGILPGITRGVVLDLFASDAAVETRDISL